MKYFLLALCFIAYNSHSQGLKIPGQVLDINKNPIENATISVVGLNQEAITDATGIFSLDLPNSIIKSSIITLRVKKVGYYTTSRHVAASPIMQPFKLLKIKGYKPTATTPKSNPPSPAINTGISQPLNNINPGPNQHLVTGFGNTVGVNGDVNINQEKTLSNQYLDDIYNYLNKIITNNKNFDWSRIDLSTESYCNYPKISQQIITYLNGKGCHIIEGFGTNAPPIEQVKIDTLIVNMIRRGNKEKKYISILVGRFN